MHINDKQQQLEPGKVVISMKTMSKFFCVSAALGLAIATQFQDSDVANAELEARVHNAAIRVQHGTATGTTTGPAVQQFDSASFSVDIDNRAISADVAAVAAIPEDLMGPPQFVAGEKTVDAKSNRVTAMAVAPRDKMSGAVAALFAAGGDGLAEIVVRYGEHPELFDDERVASLGGEVTRSYEHLKMRALRIPAASLLSLAGEDNVDWLSVDDEISSTSVASRTAANMPTSGSVNAGYNGTSVGIAVLDTGVSKHGDLSEDILQYSFLDGAYPEPVIVSGEIAMFNDSMRDDKYGHGTHVAGLLSGSGTESGDEYKGPASAAKVLALQVLDMNGAGSMSDVMAALDWLLTYGDYFDIRVVNLSLGKGISESNETDPLVIAVEKLWDAGMVVVVAAGNEGFSGSMTIGSPANSRKVITVGSLTDNGTGTDYSDDYVSSFSSTGPTIGDYVMKPDLLAPGNRVVAAIPKNSKLAKALAGRMKSCTGNSCTSDYLELSGTSMATPIVSATVALMLDKDPSLTPATVKARLMRSAMKIDALPSDSGAGLLDAEAALNDAGVVSGDALSPLMVFDDTIGGVLVEDTGILWGDDIWSSAYLFSNALNWTSGASYTDEDGVEANGFMWTDGAVSAKGYMWTDGGLSAKGYMWTDGVGARSLLDGDNESELVLNDDVPNAP